MEGMIGRKHMICFLILVWLFTGIIGCNSRNHEATAENSEILVKSTQTAAAITPDNTQTPATAATGTPEALPLHVQQLMQSSTKNINPHPVVGIAKGDQYAETTRQAIENAGGLKNIIKKGDTVLIKPNLVMPVPATSGTTTDYRVVAEIVKIVKECGASKVIIGEGSQAGVFAATGMDLIEDVELVDFNDCDEDRCYYLKALNSQAGTAFYIPKIYMDVNKVIAVPKMKIHSDSDAVVTLSLKDSIGVPPTHFYSTPQKAYKTKLHSYGLKNTIVDLNQIRKPDFFVIDGIIGMEENGPVGGKPINSNVMIAGDDPVAVDTVGLTLMGFSADEVPHVQLAAKVGLGINNLADIKTVGPDIDAIKMNFKRCPLTYD